jgi:hypothetical protein
LKIDAGCKIRKFSRLPIEQHWFRLASTFVIFLMASYLLLMGPGLACNICLPYPTKTALDYALESETLLLARENPQRPYSYVPIEILKGRYDGSIPLFVDSTTKRILDTHPNYTVVLARNATLWKNVGFASEEYENVLREVVSRHGFEAEKYSLERALFFVPFLKHPDRQLSDLAHLEVARAPYSIIRGLNNMVPREKIYRTDDVAFVRRRVEAAAKFDMNLNLAAYLTAYIEMAGQKGIDIANKKFLANRDRDTPIVVEVLKALSVHGREGRTELRHQIVKAYSGLLASRPELAGYVARDLTDWRQTQFTRAMVKISTTIELDEPSELAVRAYLLFVGTAEALAAIQAIEVKRKRAANLAPLGR